MRHSQADMTGRPDEGAQLPPMPTTLSRHPATFHAAPCRQTSLELGPRKFEYLLPGCSMQCPSRSIASALM
jgi:hypothetical protein